jgi:hypothetical protein
MTLGFYCVRQITQLVLHPAFPVMTTRRPHSNSLDPTADESSFAPALESSELAPSTSKATTSLASTIASLKNVAESDFFATIKLTSMQSDVVVSAELRDGPSTNSKTICQLQQTLHSFDGVFFFDKREEDNAILTADGIAQQKQAKMMTIIDMFRGNYLQPTVVVLMGEATDRQRYEHALLALVRSELGDKLRETQVEIICEDDKVNCSLIPKIHTCIYILALNFFFTLLSDQSVREVVRSSRRTLSIH